MSIKGFGPGWQEALRLRAALELAEEALRYHHDDKRCEDADEARAALRTFSPETSPESAEERRKARKARGREIVIGEVTFKGPHDLGTFTVPPRYGNQS